MLRVNRIAIRKCDEGETMEINGVAALLTMRVSLLIPG